MLDSIRRPCRWCNKVTLWSPEQTYQ